MFLQWKETLLLLWEVGSDEDVIDSHQYCIIISSSSIIILNGFDKIYKFDVLSTTCILIILETCCSEWFKWLEPTLTKWDHA